MTRNEQYWIDRADRRMDSYTLSAIAQARIINQSYNQLCNYVQSEIAKILRHIGDEGTLAYEYRMKRLTALLERTNKRMQELYGVTLGDTTEFLRSIIPEAYYHTIFDIAQGTGYQPMFSAVNNRLIDKIINENWSGQNYSKRIWRNTDSLAEKIRGVLTEAAMSGESIYKTSKKLSEAFAVSEYVSKRLIQTETTYACGQAELASYNELDIAEYKYVATLDERTCPICGSHDGEIYLVKDAKPGVNYKPMHPHCHCDMLAYFGEEYEPKERAARDKNGKRIRVPADMTYKDWYKNYIENGSQSAPTPARGNNTPKPSGKPQRAPESVPATVDVPAPKVDKPEYTDTHIPPKINNQSIDNSVQNDIIKGRRSGTGSDNSNEHYSEKIGNINYNDKKAIALSLLDFENDYIDSNIEHCRVFTTSGEVYEVHGDRYSVNTDILGDKMKDSINIHNHVKGESQYSFSWEDLESSAKDGSKTVLGFDEKYRYKMTFPDEMISEDVVYDAYESAKRSVGDDLIFHPNAIPIGDEQHERIKRTCKELGIKYSRVPR